MSEIIEYYHITGKADFFLKSATKDIPNYENLILYLLLALSNIQSLKTSIFLLTFKQKSNLLKQLWL